jgi:hypothetical protein
VEKLKQEIKLNGKSAKGRKELLRHFDGGKLTLRQAVAAKCYDCCGYYADGKIDCDLISCPLHPFMPYRSKK